MPEQAHLVRHGSAVSASLVRLGELVRVIKNRPYLSVSGTCPFCASVEGELVDEVGSPPLHGNCRCTTELVQAEAQPGDVLEEYFEIGTPAEESVEEGGVEEV